MLQSMGSKELDMTERLKSKRPDYTFRQGFTGVPAAAGRSQKQQVPLLTHWLSGGKLVPSMGLG